MNGILLTLIQYHDEISFSFHFGRNCFKMPSIADGAFVHQTATSVLLGSISVSIGIFLMTSLSSISYLNIQKKIVLLPIGFVDDLEVLTYPLLELIPFVRRTYLFHHGGSMTIKSYEAFKFNFGKSLISQLKNLQSAGIKKFCPSIGISIGRGNTLPPLNCLNDIGSEVFQLSRNVFNRELSAFSFEFLLK